MMVTQESLEEFRVETVVVVREVCLCPGCQAPVLQGCPAVQVLQAYLAAQLLLGEPRMTSLYCLPQARRLVGG